MGLNFIFYVDQQIHSITSRSVCLKMKYVSATDGENIKTYILRSIKFFFAKIVPFMRKCGKIFWNQAGHT